MHSMNQSIISKFIVLLIGSFFVLMGCQPNDSTTQTNNNPAAEGFNMEASDDKAIAIADSMMNAMGGRANWDNTEIIHWNFFGQRTHTWNKTTGRDRIVMADSSVIIDFDINSREGTVTKNGEEVTEPDSVEKYLNLGYKMWANDSYWLIMPYKLKDSGVMLNYMGKDTTQTGIPAYKLKLTFDSVGVTPQNMYHIYVDTTNYMVRQWAYFPKADMEAPRFVLPWKDYKKYGNILLSGNRGEYTISDIKVMDEWPDSE